MAIKELITSRPKLRYQEVMDVVSNGINSGQYAPGEKLPGMKDISRQLGMNFLTVRRAMTELAEKGLIEIRHGAGTFVAKRPVAQKTKNVKLGLACRTYMLHGDKYHPALGAYLAGAHQRCKTPKFILQPLFYDEHRFVEELGQTILSEGLSGVIILAGGMREEDYEFLHEHHLCVVNCAGGPRHDGRIITVRIDRSAVLRQSIEHLRSFGHKRIAYITFSQQDDYDNTSRYYAQLAFDYRLGSPNELMVLVGNTNLDTHWEDVENFFKIDPLPTAVIVSDEFLADVVLDGCERRGIKVPDRLSIVALQDARPEGHRIPLTATTTPESLRQKAFKAADLLVRQIAGDPIESENMDVVIAPQLIGKASSGPVVSEIDFARSGA